MNFLKSIVLALSLSTLCIPQAHSRVEDGTGDLINTIADSGIAVVINGDRCSQGEFLGIYSFKGIKRQMTLCPGSSVDPIDHATVRHEVFHAIQHCVNAARGTSKNTPVQNDYAHLRDLINEHVSSTEVEDIRTQYPQEHWWVEWEATMAEHIFTAKELETIFLQTCTM